VPLHQKPSFALPSDHLGSLKSIEQGYWWFTARTHWVKNFIYRWLFAHPTQTLDYVDLGCGSGGLGTEIINEFTPRKKLLVDGDPEALALVSPSLPTLRVDLNRDFELPWQPNLITCMDVLEHIEEDQHFIDRIRDQLVPDGLLILSVPAHPWLYSKWDRSLGHYRRYTRKEMKAKLYKSGLLLIQARFMWSFLVPMGLFRNISRSSTEFPKVPRFVNKALIHLSRWEWRLPSKLQVPFGTSLMVAATRR